MKNTGLESRLHTNKNLGCQKVKVSNQELKYYRITELLGMVKIMSVSCTVTE